MKEKWEYGYDPDLDEDRFSAKNLMSQMNAIIESHYRIWSYATEQALRCRDEAEHGKKEKF